MAISGPHSAISPSSQECPQVEYYFSRENLYQDAYLVGKMDAQHYVEVSVIADFKALKQLTTDQALILDTVKDSTKVLVLGGLGMWRGCSSVRKLGFRCR
jgi:hypothetical protein